MADPSIGKEFAGCRVEKRIGAGGMGVVYRGTDLTLQRSVAIKLIATDRAGDESARRRFEREARAMAAIDHANVVPVYAAGEQDGDLYLIMRYVDGTDLQQKIREEGALTPGETARVIDQVARALDAAHARGLVHRDIKPANVLLSDEHVYLTDFGITRLVDEGSRTTDTGTWIGTVDFTSPEHLRGEETDARADVYSLGCVLYACLTGVAPFKRTTVAATVAAHLNDRPPLPSHTHPPLTAAWDQIVGRALAKQPSHRYASAGELAEAVTAAAEGRPTRWGRGAKPINPGKVETPARPAAPSRGPKATALGETAPTRSLKIPTRSETVPTRSLTGPTRSQAALTRSQAAVTRFQGADEVPTLRVSASPDAAVRRRGPVAIAAAALLVVIVAVVLVVALNRTRIRPLTPLSAGQITNMVTEFAADYSQHDAAGIATLLAPSVTRMTSLEVEHGAAAVLADYRSQFNVRPQPGRYSLSDMVITPGWVGRASGDYTLRLGDGALLHGHATFAIQRIAGRVKIGLIVTQQQSATAGPSPTGG